jgi:hypothetical protein
MLSGTCVLGCPKYFTIDTTVNVGEHMCTATCDPTTSQLLLGQQQCIAYTPAGGDLVVSFGTTFKTLVTCSVSQFFDFDKTA